VRQHPYYNKIITTVLFYSTDIVNTTFFNANKMKSFFQKINK